MPASEFSFSAMQQVIDGRRFDTETATKLGDTSLGDPELHTNWARQTLYISPRGQYFVHREGGPDSTYSHAHLALLSPAEALRWAEGYDQSATAHFEIMIEEG